MMSLGRERIAAHEAHLLAYAQERLRGMNSLRIIGTAKDNAAAFQQFSAAAAAGHPLAAYKVGCYLASRAWCRWTRTRR